MQESAAGAVHNKHWSAVRRHYARQERLPFFSRAYRRILGRYYRFFVPENVSVLEVGCGSGGLLNELPNRERHGLDLLPGQIDAAREAIPDATFMTGPAETVTFGRTYDYLIVSDTLNEAADAQQFLENLLAAATPGTRLVLNAHNTLWRPLLSLARRLGLKPKRPPSSWLSRADIINLLDLAGWELVRSDTRILLPLTAPGLDAFFNRFLAPFLGPLCLTLFFVARPCTARRTAGEPSVSVIIPARNEAGNIAAAIGRTPAMGRATEIIFVEGHSSDGTWQAIQREIAAHPERDIKAFRQTGRGKGDAMRLGYAHAGGEIVMILDADLTVPPEDLPKFYRALVSGRAEFANGVRLVYPMDDQAMRFLNMCGNKFFSLLFSWLLNQPIKDTLCGTKVFWKSDYEKIAANRPFFGEFDPFGDFDLIFGAVKLNLHLRDIPVRYHNRTYGETQINRWRDGALLLRMSWFAARKLKFF